MKTFFIDFEVQGCGMLTLYVKASCKEVAEESLNKYVKNHEGCVEVQGVKKEFIQIVNTYLIDQVPEDCYYLNEDGEFTL